MPLVKSLTTQMRFLLLVLLKESIARSYHNLEYLVNVKGPHFL